ncbi:adenylate/guanylate cyclase domain-containing protein [Candidatus Dojkabacteria bacterium]|nr:adenylate/guanylate cyclase domain-containing protein [Candidatus Dojkabacteria bacterium]
MKKIQVNNGHPNKWWTKFIQFSKEHALYIHIVIVAVFVYLLTNIHFVEQINSFLGDSLQVKNEPGDEIVIIGIDDKSLEIINQWPLDKSLYSTLVQKLSQYSPKVVAFDLLMFNETADDYLVNEILTSVDYDLVFASRIFQDTIVNPTISGENITYGYSNIPIDADGRVRRGTIATQVGSECNESLAYAVFRKYQDEVGQATCSNGITLSSGKKLDNVFMPIFPKNEFKTVSFVDVLEDKFDQNTFKDKIVLVGTMTTGVNAFLDDHVVNVNGKGFPEIYIFASYINAFLRESFIVYPSYLLFSLSLVVVLLVVARLTEGRNFFKSLWLWITFFLGFNLLGILCSCYGCGWYFVQGSLLIFTTYVYFTFFNSAKAYLENSFIRKAFSCYLNIDLLKKIMRSKQELNLGGEERIMTVMFNDIREFSTISEEIAPERLVSLTNDYLDTMSKIIIKNDGTIDKYIGDCIMAIWNAPVFDEKHCLKAVVTAMQMVDTLKRFNDENKHGVEIRIGIGLHTGPMVVGNIGSKVRFDYTVIGDNVNVASRVEGLTKKYNVPILVTETVKDCVSHDAIIFRQIDEILVKGKNRSIKIFEPMFNTRRNVILRRAYVEGLRLYQSGKFNDAIKVFKLLKYDGAAKALIERIRNNHFPDDWDGVYRWDTK